MSDHPAYCSQDVSQRLGTYRKSATKNAKALSEKDMAFVEFGVNYGAISTQEWLTVGAVKAEANSHVKHLQDDETEDGVNSGGLAQQVPAALNLLSDKEHAMFSFATLRLKYKSASLSKIREKLVQEFRETIKEGKAITKRDEKLIKLGIFIISCLTVNWLEIGADEEGKEYSSNYLDDKVDGRKNAGGIIEKENELISLLKKKEEVKHEEDGNEEDGGDGGDESDSGSDEETE